MLYADYDEQYAIIELIGEWNDALHNDIMEVKRRVIDPMLLEGIQRFVLIGDNLLNLHAGSGGKSGGKSGSGNCSRSSRMNCARRPLSSRF